MKIKKEPSVLRRRFSMLNLTLTVIFLSLFTYLQFDVMDDIFLVAQKNSLIAIAKEIDSLDYESETFKNEMSDIEANNSVYVEIYYPRDRLIYTTDSNKVVYEQSDSTVPPEDLQPRVMKLISQ